MSVLPSWQRLLCADLFDCASLRWQLEATADILEREAFLADESDIMAHPLVRTTEAFLVKHLQLGDVSAAAAQAGGKGKKGRAGPASSSAQQKEGAEKVPVDGSMAPYITLLISLSGGKTMLFINLSQHSVHY
jgi:hypothetical protein